MCRESPSKDLLLGKSLSSEGRRYHWMCLPLKVLLLQARSHQLGLWLVFLGDSVLKRQTPPPCLLEWLPACAPNLW